MKSNTAPQSILWSSIGLGMQLLLSYAVVVVVAIEIAEQGQTITALVAAVVAGMALTFTVQRTLWLASAALANLNAGRSPAAVSPRWHGPLSSLIAQINALVTREREVHDLRRNLLHQAGESAAQQERNRLARELHDSIKQQIFSISMGAAAVQARWDTDPNGAREALNDVRRSAQEAMVEMNALLQQLSPAPLEKVGLIQALRDQCEALGYRTGAEVTAELGELPGDDRLPPGGQESLFRIAQEALSNIARHARAGRVRLYLGQRDASGPLVLEIQDDGQGFKTSTSHNGMGLENIHQRALAMNGRLAIDSAPGKGTLLRVTVPLVESILSQEDTMYKLNHTLNKVFLVGLSGGLALIAALFYPLYIVLPGGYVDGWPTGSGATGFILEIMAVLLAVATGFLAARWVGANTRQDGALFGALAGGVAGAILHFGIGVSAAGVAGSVSLLEHGLTPAAGKVDYVRLVVEGIIGNIWATYGLFWGTLLIGMGLGAIGGLLAPPATGASGRSNLRLAATAILPPAVLFSSLSFFAAVLIFSLLEPTIREAIVEYDVSLKTSLPLAGISFWSIGTPMIFYLVSLAALCFLLRVEVKTEDMNRLNIVQIKAVTFGLISFGIPIFILLANPSLIRPTSALGVAVVVTVIGSLVLGGLYFATLAEARRRRRALGLKRLRIIQFIAVVTVPLSLVIMVWAVSFSSLGQFLVGLVVVITGVVFIIILRRQPKQPLFDTATLARLRFTMSQSINAGLGSVVAMVIPSMVTVSAVISMVMLTSRFILILENYDRLEQPYLPNFTLVELVHNIYLIQARTFLISFVVAVVIIGLLMLITSGIIVVVKLYLAQNTETAWSSVISKQ